MLRNDLQPAEALDCDDPARRLPTISDDYMLLDRVKLNNPEIVIAIYYREFN